MHKGKDSREDKTVLSNLVWMEEAEEASSIKGGRCILNSFISHVKKTEHQPEEGRAKHFMLR